MHRWIVALALLLAPGAAVAQTPRASYVARLSWQDHHASDGVRLDTVAGIIRQDRANFHRFGRRDPEDESDPVFGSTANRGTLERMLLRGSVTARARQAILRGEPLISVQIFADRVVVDIVEASYTRSVVR